MHSCALSECVNRLQFKESAQGLPTDPGVGYCRRMADTDTERVTFRIPEHVVAALDRRAIAEQRSRSWVIRQFVVAGLNRDDSEDD